jgi:hypothetical protein
MARKPPKGKSLAEVNPELAKQWHSSKNGDLTPSDFFSKSGIKVWWKCQKGDDHVWESIIVNRTKGRGCPMCSNYITVKSNCLATTHPQLATQWHPSKNNTLSPEILHMGLIKKFGGNVIRERIMSGIQVSEQELIKALIALYVQVKKLFTQIL